MCLLSLTLLAGVLQILSTLQLISDTNRVDQIAAKGETRSTSKTIDIRVFGFSTGAAFRTYKSIDFGDQFLNATELRYVNQMKHLKELRIDSKNFRAEEIERYEKIARAIIQYRKSQMVKTKITLEGSISLENACRNFEALGFGPFFVEMNAKSIIIGECRNRSIGEFIRQVEDTCGVKFSLDSYRIEVTRK